MPDLSSAADERDRFLYLIGASLERGSFARLVLAKPRAEAGDRLRVSVRAIELRGRACLSFVHTHPTRDLTENLAIEDGPGGFARAARDRVLARASLRGG